MRKIFFTSLTVLVIALQGCNDNKSGPGLENYATPSTTADAIADSLKSTGRDIRAEMEVYRNRIRNRIDEMRADIEAQRAQRKAERNVKKQKEYDAEIERKEGRRKTLEERLNRLEKTVDAEWDKFKQDVDDFFSNDSETYRNAKDSAIMNH